VTDNRKVVVEDLLYIDDLEILIYTLVAPQTSTVFITHTQKEKQPQAPQPLKFKQLSQLEQAPASEGQTNLQPNHFQLLARLRGHRNNCPPTIAYIPQSGCLITGEKHFKEPSYQTPKETYPSLEDPSKPVLHQFLKSSQTTYERVADKQQQAGFSAEIIIWNI